AQPQHPAVITSWFPGDTTGQPVTRTDDAISAFVPSFFDNEGRWGLHDSRIDGAPFQLFEDGTLIASSEGWFGTYNVTPGSHRYRADLTVTRNAPFWALSTKTHTLWAFRSATTAPGATEAVPLLVLDYNPGTLDLLNRAVRGTTQKITVTAHRQQLA